MPSPFPGMNPYFEQAEDWQDFHTEFLTVLRRFLHIQIGPLRPADPDLRIELQEVLHQVYDGVGYQKFIYEGKPEPPLAAEDAEWTAQFLPRP